MKKPHFHRTVLAIAAAALLAPMLRAQAPATPNASASEPASKSPAKPWTVEEIYKDGGPSERPPKDGVWSPDSRRFTFVAQDAQTGQAGDILQIDAATGKASVLASKSKLSVLTSTALTEQDRDHRDRYDMASYLWAPDARHLLLDGGGQLWLYSLATGTGTQVASTGSGSGDDPKFSPDAGMISYIRDHNLYVRPVNGREEVPLTSTHGDFLLNGEVDWVYLEELETRSNYFWSPDSSRIAYLQMDEQNVPQYPITDLIPTHAKVENQRYPQPGDSNPALHVGIVSARGGRTNWLQIPVSENNDYIPRFGWIDRKTVYVEVLRRDQKHLEMYFADVASGVVRKVFTEEDAKYIDTNYDAEFLPGGQFVWTSWRDGHAHLYLYSFNAEHPVANEAVLVRQLTKGDFTVDSVAAVNQAKQAVFYISNEGDPLQHQLWSVGLNGEGKHRITTLPGDHDVTISPDGNHFADNTGASLSPVVSDMCNMDGACATFWRSASFPSHTLVAPVDLQFTAADGTTKLYGTLLLPAGATSAASVPMIVNPYGGTHAQSVKNAWGGAGFLFDQLLAEHGFAVLHVDNRGMGGRSRDFEQAAYHNFGPVQFSDQMAAIDQVLARYPQLDAKRLGWWGWSWGGSFTLYAMTHSDRFRAGVSVAPVTDWKNYDSIYTERYMGQPSENPDGYKTDSVVNSAAKLKGRLLIAHGTGDDNVHLANDIQMIQQFINADLPYDYQIYPRKTHSILGQQARTQLFNRILWQFETYLK